MKHKLITVLLATLLSSNAIAADQPKTIHPTTKQTQTNPEQTHEREILGWLIVLNTNQIDSAKELLRRKELLPQVKDYAQTTVNQHTKLLQDTKSLGDKDHITPTKNTIARNLEQQGKQRLSDLKELDDTDVQKPYINAMITAYTDTQAAINGFIKTESNAEIKKLLETTNQEVSANLEKAQKVQKEIES